MLAERSPVHCCVPRSRMSGAAHAVCANDPALICPGMMHQTMMPSYKIFCTHWDSKHSGACPTEEDIQVRVDTRARERSRIEAARGFHSQLTRTPPSSIHTQVKG